MTDEIQISQMKKNYKVSFESPLVTFQVLSSYGWVVVTEVVQGSNLLIIAESSGIEDDLRGENNNKN